MLHRLWDQVEPLLRSVEERSRGRWPIEAMLTEIAKGNWQLWCVWDGTVRAIVGTEIYREMNGKRYCGIRFVSGSGLKDWVAVRGDLEAWAAAEGCVAIDTWARKGWAKHLPDYRLTHVLLEKDLT